ncbi:MAG TPA: winged helix DNA-binding domain-containing protein [Solirubrobacteraceae bacterium]|nr:winged helix DNA-binding domain-containing protein [Solirubrobacteraceae bacterium]
MTPPTLTTAELNRATLARQMLLERGSGVGVSEAVQQLAGMQAQEPKHPFVGLWSRLDDFDESSLRSALQERSVVRATLMRSTLHVMSGSDYSALRTGLQPPMSVALRVLGARAEGLEPDKVVPAAKRLLKRSPLTFDEIRSRLQEQFPDVNDRALGYAVRTLLPLVMVPDEDARWGFGRSVRFTLAEQWLDEPLAGGEAAAPALARRYLGAFGPASAKDLQAWSGVGGMKEVLDGMRDELEIFTDESGGRRELFDVPDAPRPGADVAPPPRLLPEFDTLMLAWDDRSRIIAKEHRPLVTTKNLRVKATFLVDGVVAGTWTIAVKRRMATLTLSPFGPKALPQRALKDLQAEAERLVLLIEPEAKDHAVQFEPA